MEEKINLLYNFLYNSNSINSFSIDKITLGQIGLDDIKLIDETEINECIDELIKKGKFSYLNYNKKDLLIYFIRYSDSYPITVKIGTYTNDINDLNNFSNNDALFSYLLSQLVLNKKTKHILLPIVNFDIPFDKIENLIKTIGIYNVLKEKIDFNEIKNIFSVRIREHFFKSISLGEYLLEHICSYKPLLFQIIHTLAVIQKEFPGFRHNNLTPENILIYLKKENLSNNIYEYGKNNWVIPNIGFDIKITNFEKSVIPKYYGVMNQRDTDVPYINDSNDYFDLHTFLNSLIEGNYKISLQNNSNCELDTKKFLNKMIPNEYRGLKKGSYYLDKNIVVHRPADLLDDPYFNEYKNIKKENLEEKVSSNTYYTNMNKIKMDSKDDSILDDQKRYIKINKDNNLKIFNKNLDSYTFIKLKGGAYYENPHVEKPEVIQTNENKKIEADNVRELKPKEPQFQPNKFNPMEDKPYMPRENKPYIPRENKPYIPRENKPYMPREDKPYMPREDKPYMPREDKPYIPREDKPYMPREDKPYMPREDKPYMPREDKPYMPRENKPYMPREDKPYMPRENKPREDKPYMPRETKFSKDKPDDLNKTLEPLVENFETKKSINTNLNMPDMPPGLIPLYDVNNTLLGSMAPYNYNPTQLPINKIYNISLSDPLGNHSLINKVYEDVLPSDKSTYSFIKINEREAIKSFMRNSILDKYDGEELSLKGGEKSLLSWIKIFDLNPYGLISNTTNPYNNIPYGFLLYRSAYPIRYNKQDHVLKTTSTSMAFNLRIYKLSVGAIKYKNNHHFDVWRDLKYYEWVNTVIKRKISPNFLNYILYVSDNKSSIKFKDLDIIIKKNNADKFYLQQENNNLINEIIKESDIEIINTVQNASIKEHYRHNRIHKRVPHINNFTNVNNKLEHNMILPENEIDESRNNKINSIINIDLTQDSEKLLVIVTEAQNSNIIKWNSQVYQSYGTIKKMISTGYHKPEVWYSILFQLIYACAVMEKEEIYFNNFSLKNNVFIKDVQTDNTGNSCWVYKINNIEYYIPNYGYLVVIDSNYADIESSATTLGASGAGPVVAGVPGPVAPGAPGAPVPVAAVAAAPPAPAPVAAVAAAAAAAAPAPVPPVPPVAPVPGAPGPVAPVPAPTTATAVAVAAVAAAAAAAIEEAKKKIQYKIYGKNFEFNGSKQNFKQEFKNILIKEIIKGNFENDGANTLNDDVKNMIDNINKKLTSEPNISNIFEDCFKMFVNSKVGKILTKLEKENLNLLAKPDYRTGAIMVRQKRYDEYDWVVYLGNDKNMKKIINKDINNKLEITSVFSSCLYSYPENVLPEDKTIIETYTFI